MKPSVLVVDDESGVRSLLQAGLESAGYPAAAAEDAPQALAAVSENPVQVAVVDIILPGISGLELCRQLHDDYNTEVILITGDDLTYSYEDAVESGAADFIVKPIKLGELALRIEKALNAKRMRESRDRVVNELKRLVISDGLTGLYNSRCFFDRLETEIARAGRYGRKLSLLLIDVDHFKQYNDTHGHQEGDKALRRIAAIIRAGIRTSDSAYRYGGEEFTVLLPEADAKAARFVADRAVTDVASVRLETPDDASAGVTVSVGVAEWLSGEALQSFLQRADQAMYASKANGRNCVTVSTDPPIDAPADERLPGSP